MFVDVIEKIFDQDVPSIVRNYMELYGILDLKETQILKELFDKIDKCELREANVISDGLIKDGLVMIPKEKNNMHVLNEQKINYYINSIMTNINRIEDGYYLKTLITLIKKLNYIDYEEQVILNYLFYELNVGTKKIEELESKKYVIK